MSAQVAGFLVISDLARVMSVSRPFDETNAPPRVKLLRLGSNDSPAYFTPDEARQLGVMLTLAADAAEGKP